MKKFLFILPIVLAVLICIVNPAIGQDTVIQQGVDTSNNNAKNETAVNMSGASVGGSIVFGGSQTSAFAAPYSPIQPAWLIGAPENGLRLEREEIFYNPYHTKYNLEELKKLNFSNFFEVLLRPSRWGKTTLRTKNIAEYESPLDIMLLKGWPEPNEQLFYLGTAIINKKTLASREMVAAKLMREGIEKMGADCALVFLIEVVGSETEAAGLGAAVGTAAVQGPSWAHSATIGGQDARTKAAPDTFFKGWAVYWRANTYRSEIKIKELTLEEKEKLEYNQAINLIAQGISSGNGRFGPASIAFAFDGYRKKLLQSGLVTEDDLRRAFLADLYGPNSGGGVMLASAGGSLNTGTSGQLARIESRLNSLEKLLAQKWNESTQNLLSATQAEFPIPEANVVEVYYDTGSFELRTGEKSKPKEIAQAIFKVYESCKNIGQSLPRITFEGGASREGGKTINFVLAKQRAEKLKNLTAKEYINLDGAGNDTKRFDVTTSGPNDSAPEKDQKSRVVRVSLSFRLTTSPPM